MKSVTTPSFELFTSNAGTTQAGEVWIHVCPAGTFTAIDGRGPWTVNDPELVVQRTLAYHGKKQMPVDYEHQSLQATAKGFVAPAAGWVSKFKVETDGIWALVKWTDNAALLIANREYRYVSPVLKHTPDGEILFIVNVALTNNPALDALTAVASASLEENSEMTALQEALDLLNLPEQTTPETIIDLCRKLIPLAQALLAESGSTDKLVPLTSVDMSKFVPITEFKRVLTDLNSLRQGISRKDAEDIVQGEIQKGKLLPYLKDWAVTLCEMNRPAFEAFVAETGGSVFNSIFVPQSKGARGRRVPALDDEQNSVRVLLGLSVEEFEAAKSSD